MVVRKDELCLRLEELNLSLPNGRRHARWTHVYESRHDHVARSVVCAMGPRPILSGWGLLPGEGLQA